MLNPLSIFITSFIIGLSGAMMPGPLLTVTIANSAKRGFWEGPKLIVGHGILELLLVILILFGISPIIKSNIFVVTISLIGGCMLAYMGYDMIKSAKKLTLDTSKDCENSPYKSPVLTGAMVSFANPYWLLWWATIGMGYLFSSMKFGLFGVFVFFAGHILSDFIWYACVAFGISKGKTIMKDSTYQMIITLCGVFLIVFGIYFVSSIKKFI